MNLKKTALYRSLAESYSGFADRLFLIRSVLSDISFFSLFAVVYTYYFNPGIVRVITSISELVSEMSGNLPASADSVPTQEAMQALLPQKEAFMQLFSELLVLFALLAFFVYAIWCIFQGTSWWAAHRKLKHKTGWCRFQQRFSLASLIYALAFIVVYYIVLKLSSLLTIGAIELMDAESIIRLMGIALVIVMYFAFISYSLLDQTIGKALKQTFVLGVKKAGILVPAYLIIVAKAIILFAMLMLLGLDLFYTVIIGLIIFIPLAAWARLFMGVAVGKAAGR